MKKLVVAGMLTLAALSGQASAFSMPLFAPGGAGQNNTAERTARQPLVLVQSGDPSIRIQQLEEEIRQLNGRVEEMSFQLLQMQEQMRKTQEDNEFRFQELEKSEGKTGGANAAPGAAGNDDVARIIETPASSGNTVPPAAPSETTLGSITMDSQGMPIGVTLNQDANNASSLPGVDLGPQPQPTQTARLTSEDDIYNAAYGHVLAGDYQLAEQEFESYVTSYPNGAKIADANFWLGEAQYSQGKFNEAAKTFLNAHQAHAQSPRAPEMLLKLGMSLASLDNNETACATLREVSKRYPTAPRAVLNKVASEQKRLSC